MADGDLVLSTAEKAALLVRLDPATIQGGGFSTPSQKTVELADCLYEVVDAVASKETAGSSGEIIIKAAAKTLLLGRLKPSVMFGGTHPSPHEKSMEIADILKDVITGVVVT